MWQVFETGEAFFMVRRKKRSGAMFRFSFKVVDPARLSAGYRSSHQGCEIRKEVEIDRDEQVVAYWIQN